MITELIQIKMKGKNVIKEDSVANEFFISLHENQKFNNEFVKKYKNMEKISKKYKFVK